MTVGYKAIAAMSQNRVIGSGATIPWHLPEDFRWFKSKTVGHILVMGRKTFESIGAPLPDRDTFVVSRSPGDHPGVRWISDLSNLPEPTGGKDVFICGGGEIYRQTLNRCTDLFLTLVKRTVDGDVLFPSFEDQFEQIEMIRETEDFRITHYKNMHCD